MKVTRTTVFLCKKVNYFQLAILLLPIFLFSETKVVDSKNADWTLVVFVQASNSLKNFAQPNFTAMGSIGSSTNLNILVQCYFPQTTGIYRYKIEKGKMVLDSHIQEESDGTSAKDLVGAFRWAKSKYPAQKYALILWNHGIGIIDPSWGNIKQLSTSQKFFIEREMLSINPRICINDLTVDQPVSQPNQNISLVENIFTQEEIDLFDNFTSSEYDATKMFRGILFNEQTKSYMTNNALVDALREIKKNVLNGKKIDLLGMDACLMAMIEVSYQSRQYAKYLVASEESELAHGWDYASLCQAMSEKSTPQKVACGIVANYEKYYKNKINFYTLSAIDLSRMDELKLVLDAVLKLLKNCIQVNRKHVLAAIKKARISCQQFSASNYIDLHSFLVEFSKQTNQLDVINKKNSELLNNLKTSLKKSITFLEQTVIANTSGKLLDHANGLSIYFPMHSIDHSYLQTEFSQASSWTHLLREFVPAS